MKKISQTIWNRYKNSEEGKATISMFNALISGNLTAKEIIEIAKQYDLPYFKEWSNKDLNNYTNWLEQELQMVSPVIKDIHTGTNDYKETFKEILCIYANIECSFDESPESTLKNEICDIVAYSIFLSISLPEFFIPYLFVYQFNYFQSFADKYEIDLPKVPNRANYKERCLYYYEVCRLLNEFSKYNGFENSAQLCAFIYGSEMPIIIEDFNNEFDKEMPSTPEQAWILVGNYVGNERNMKVGPWQANPFTSKGDVMLFYEKSPVKKLNSIWISMTDGVVDPFFHYYSYTFIGKKIDIPEDQAITFSEFKNSEYFKVENHGTKGNFVSKNFQDVSGWQVSTADYNEIKRMLNAKGFDTSKLPSLYEPKGFNMDNINNENDVYNNLVTPLLEEMGWKKDIDFEREVEFAAGHSTTGHAMNKRPDYCLHLRREGKMVYAKVVIEAKYSIDNNKELDETFDQCHTYANWGKAKVLVICDKNSIIVYEQNRNGEFEKGRHRTRYRWAQLKNPEIFQELKRKLDI